MDEDSRQFFLSKTNNEFSIGNMLQEVQNKEFSSQLEICCRKYRLEKQIASMTWKIPYSDIVFSMSHKGARGRFGSHMSLGRASQQVRSGTQTVAPTESKNGVILTQNIESLAELKFNPGFLVIWESLSQIDFQYRVQLTFLIESNWLS